MSKRFSVLAGKGRSGATVLLLVLWLMASAASSWAAGPGERASNSSREDPFASYQTALSGAADSLLARSAAAQPAPAPGGDAPSESAAEQAQERPATSGTPGLRAALQRVQQLRPALEPILRDAGLPAGFAAVVLVESGGQPAALSSKGARGLWQLMPATARRYGLTVNQNQDERLDVRKSTRAAAQYLRDLYEQFGDWPLALAAYNAGEQAVKRAVDRAGAGDFFRISRWLPDQTRLYVPAVMNTRWLFGGAQPAEPAGSRDRHRVESVHYAPAGAGD